MLWWTPCGHHAENDNGHLSAAVSQHTDILEKPGAGEGIRTLDPNLGKVVLYP